MARRRFTIGRWPVSPPTDCDLSYRRRPDSAAASSLAAADGPNWPGEYSFCSGGRQRKMFETLQYNRLLTSRRTSTSVGGNLTMAGSSSNNNYVSIDRPVGRARHHGLVDKMAIVWLGSARLPDHCPTASIVRPGMGMTWHDMPVNAIHHSWVAADIRASLGASTSGGCAGSVGHQVPWRRMFASPERRGRSRWRSSRLRHRRTCRRPAVGRCIDLTACRSSGHLRIGGEADRPIGTDRTGVAQTRGSARAAGQSWARRARATFVDLPLVARSS